MKRLSLLNLLLSLLALTACGGNDDSEPDTQSTSTSTSTSKPVVVSTTPANGATDIAVGTVSVSVTYDKDINVATDASLQPVVVGATLMGKASGSGKVVSFNVNCTNYETRVSVTLPKGLVGVKGALADEYSFGFTTAKKPESPNASIATAPVVATTDAAKRLYTYFREQYGQKVISSVMADVAWNTKVAEKVKTLTGKYPAMNCFDFIHICVPDGNGWIDYSNTKPVIDWAEAGGMVQLMWHFMVPKSETTTIEKNGSGATYKPGETTFKASNALKEGTWENKYFYEQMDRVIAVILKLQEAGIAATWRPFHEAAGNATAKQQAGWTKAWFWWGYDGAETYKQLWKAMFDYFKQKGVQNLIWIWTTQNYNGDSNTYNQDTDWYPGDSYCDMVARDLYGCTAQQNVLEFEEIQRQYPTKMVVLGECGWDGNDKTGKPQGLISDCWNLGAKWGHFMVWCDGNAGNATSTMVADAWWRDAMQCADVITRE